MENREWLVLIVTVLVGLAGLFMASAGGGVYGLGLALFAVASIFGLYLIKRHFDRIDSGKR